MSLAQIRDEYRVPTRLGAPVTLTLLGKERRGAIVGSHGDRVWVRIDGREARHLADPRELTYL